MNEPHCRLFLATPDRFDGQLVMDCFSAATRSGDVASLLVRGGGHKDLPQLVETAQKCGVAVLIEDDIDLAQKLSCDGVETSGGLDAYGAARKVLGDDYIVGVNCGADRHMAMSCAEAGADYVCFTADKAAGLKEPVIEWWSQLFEVPCVARLGETVEDVNRLIGEGADFVTPPAAMWQSPGRASELVSLINCKMETC